MTIASRPADLLACLKSSGVVVTSGAMSGYGVVRVADEPVLESFGAADLIGRVIQVTVSTAVFPTLATGAAITVNGVAYKVSGKRVAIDGQILRVLCVASV
jgi:hypothetical protein